MLLRVTGVVIMAICLNLYVLDHIAKTELNRAEPKRVFYSAIAWTVAPGLGTFLYAEFSASAAYGIGGVFRSDRAWLFLVPAPVGWHGDQGGEDQSPQSVPQYPPLPGPAQAGSGLAGGDRPVRLVGDAVHLCADPGGGNGPGPDGGRHDRLGCLRLLVPDAALGHLPAPFRPQAGSFQRLPRHRAC